MENGDFIKINVVHQENLFPLLIRWEKHPVNYNVECSAWTFSPLLVLLTGSRYCIESDNILLIGDHSCNTIISFITFGLLLPDCTHLCGNKQAMNNTQ